LFANTGYAATSLDLIGSRKRTIIADHSDLVVFNVFWWKCIYRCFKNCFNQKITVAQLSQRERAAWWVSSVGHTVSRKPEVVVAATVSVTGLF